MRNASTSNVLKQVSDNFRCTFMQGPNLSSLSYDLVNIISLDLFQNN